MNAIINNYLLNRGEFYSVLLQRIPHDDLCGRLRTAVEPIMPSQEVLKATESVPTLDPENDFLKALALRDGLKKAGFGVAYGRTVISFEEALARSEWIEETGVMLFDQVATITQNSAFRQEAQQRRQTLAAILQLGDSLRYRKP